MRSLGRLGRMKVGGLVRRIPGMGKFKMPGLGLGRGAAAAQASKGGGILSKAGGLLSKIPGKGLMGAAAKSPVGKLAGRFLPGTNIAIGGALAASRLAEGDYGGALLAAGSMIPGPIGWGFLAGEMLGEGAKWLAGKNQAEYKKKNDPANVMSGLGFSSIEPKSVMPSDGSIPQIVQRDVPWWEKLNPFKMSEGGTIKLAAGGGVKAMVGEAGPEMVVGPGSEGGVNPLQSLAPMIVAMREVTKRAGTWADPVENMVRQITDPIAKKIGLPTLPATIDIGQNIPDGKQGEQGGGLKGEKKGLLGKLMDFLKGKSSGSTATSPAATPFAGDPNMGGGAGTTTAGAVYNYLLSKGMSENHAKGITANISRESGFKLGAHNPNDPGAGSFGLFQWNGGRAQNMMAAVPDWQTNWQGQIDYALGEDHGPTYLSTQFGSAGEAAYDWMKYWERPAAYVQAKYTPAAYEGMINKMGLHRGMPVAPPAPAAAPPTPASQNQAKTASENRRMGRDAAKRKQEAAATAPAQPPTTPAPVPATAASTGTVLLPLVFSQPGGGGQQAAPALPLPTTSTGEIDWMKMTRQQRLGAS